MPDLILTHVADGVATVTLNRPDKLNAFAEDMRERLTDALDSLAARDDGRAVITRLAGMPLPTVAAVNGPAAGTG